MSDCAIFSHPARSLYSLGSVLPPNESAATGLRAARIYGEHSGRDHKEKERKSEPASNG